MNKKVKQIIRHCADKHGVTPEQILGRRRVKVVAHARHEAMFLIRKVLRRRAIDPNAYALERIGALFDRDHSTVHYAIQAHKAREGAS